MKNKIIYSIIFLALISFANALDECRGTIKNTESPCLLLLANSSAHPCATMTVSVYNNGSTLLYTQSMDQYSPFNCNGTFNLTEEGTYTFLYSSGDDGSVIVVKDIVNEYYLYMISLIIFLVLVGIGYFLKESVFVIIAGMLSMIVGITILINGFPGLTDVFLKNGTVIVLIGIGLYLILAPSIEFFDNLKEN